MSNSELTHTQKLMFAEVTTALNQFVINKLNELKLEYSSGVMTPENMAQSLMQLANSASSLLDIFADRFRIAGETSLAGSVDAWSDSFTARAQGMQQQIDESDTLNALQIGLGIVSKIGKSEHALEIIGSNFGEGGTKVLKDIGKLAGGIGSVITAKEFCDAFANGSTKDMAGIAIGYFAPSLVSGLATLVLGAAATPLVMVIVVAAAAGIAGDLAENAFDKFATMFGWEDPENASEVVREALEVNNHAALAHVGDNLFWGLDIGDNYVGLTDKRNDMVGAAGNDSLTGANKRDYLNGGADNDDLVGKGDSDKLYGADGDDKLTGGTGDDVLKGGTGQDTYVFTTDDLTQAVSTDVVNDEDGIGSIVIDGTDVASMSLSEYVNGDSGIVAWQADDYKYLFTYSDADHTLIVKLRENGSQIVVHDWNNGDLGINLPQLEETHPPESAPLTTGDDLFGHAGNNTEENHITALAGNDGISAGAGDDIIDGGDDEDLIYGGSGDDTLSGGLGKDIILDDSEFVDMEDWSDDIGGDGKSQRQREQEQMDRLGSAVIAKGKGWYVYTTKVNEVTTYHTVTANGQQMLDPNQSPSGNDSIEGGVGDDVIWSGEGSDTVKGGLDDDYIDGGADGDNLYGGDGVDRIWGDTSVELFDEGTISANAQQNGNDAIHGEKGNDSIFGAGGNDLLDGGDGDDMLRGNGNDPGSLDDAIPDADYITGGIGKDTIFGDDGEDTIRGGVDDDAIGGDNPDAKTQNGDDILYGDDGNDTITGDGANDVLHGGEGDDLLLGDSTLIDGGLHGEDVLFGDTGNDAMAGGGENDVLLGGDGNDQMAGDNSTSMLDAQYHGDDYLSGGKGEDTLSGNGGNDTLDGGEGADQLFGNAGSDRLYGRDGADSMLGGDGNDALNGGEGNDSMWGLSGDDMLQGGADDDLIMGDDPSLPADKQGNDVIYGQAGMDSLYGGGGQDTLQGGDDADLLSGNDGDDELHGDDGTDIFLGGAGNDDLHGGAGSDTLLGAMGNDTLSGDAGNDLLEGGFGVNTFIVAPGEGDDAIVAPSASRPVGTVLGGVLKLEGGLTQGNIGLSRNGDNLTIVYEGGSVAIQSYFQQYDSSLDSGGNRYNFSPVTSIVFTEGTSWTMSDVKHALIQSTDGNDFITGFANNETIHGGAGDDTIKGMGGVDELYGDAGNDLLYAGLSVQGVSITDLFGGAGNDTLNGNAGADHLEGGAGNDQLMGSLGADVYTFARGDGQDTIDNHDGQLGGDALEFATGIASSDVQTIRSGNDLYLHILGTDDQIKVLNFFQNEGKSDYALSEVRFADGTVWSTATLLAKVLVGGSGDEAITGYATDDLLQGMAGNDTLNAGAGNDTMQGGNGDDVLQGADGNDLLSGDAGVDTLNGGAANDDLTGGQGNDVIDGGAGDDTYRYAIGDGSDAVTDAQGLSNLILSGTTQGDIFFRRDGANLVLLFNGHPSDMLTFNSWFDPQTGVAVRDLIVDFGDGNPVTMDATALSQAVTTGSAVDDMLYGDDTVNTVDGQGGNDIMHAAGGNDVVNGGLGNDQAFGEAGDDTLSGDVGDDRLDGGDGNDQLAGGDGKDSLSGQVGDDVLAGGIGQDQLDGGVGADELRGDADDDTLLGQSGNDALYGGGGNDSLDGGVGGDQMTGGAGDDMYVVDDAQDVVVETEDAGIDHIRSTVSYTLSDNVENLELTGSASIDGTGNTTTNVITANEAINTLEGLDGDDVLSGMGGNDTLLGGSGDDRLDGGSGIDQLTGGSGNDLYLVDNTSDVLTEQAGQGEDTVQASSDYALSANIEHLVLIEDSAAHDGIGNVGSQSITGNSYDNHLDGGAGADTLTGGSGDDTYVVDDAGDVVVEVTGQGNDAVESYIDYTLDDTVENLTLLGTTDLDGTGNGNDNALFGNAGNNRLDGGLGADDMYGGAGDDYFIAASDGDRVNEAAGEGNDTIERHFDTNLVLAANVENLVLADSVKTGNGNELDNTITGNTQNNTLGGWDGNDDLHGLGGDDQLFGGAGNDQLHGGDGKDYLDGEAGIDTLVGGKGDDSYIVDNSNDVVTEQVSEGTDAVQATSSYALSDNVENLFLMADGGAIDGTGNALDNYMSGNDADNVLRGQGGNDTLAAGKGLNLLVGGTGDDKYVIDTNSQGNAVDNSDGGFDGVFFSDGITRDDLSFARDGDDLLIFVGDAADPAVRVTNHFLGGDAAIDYVQPDGGYYLTTQEINQIVAANQSGDDYDQVIEGTSAGEQLAGGTGKDHVKGLAGDDQLFGMAGNDLLEGGDGNDYLAGGNGNGTGSGDDQLEGGAGGDTLTGEDGTNVLTGGIGDDSYVYDGGQDTIDNTGGGNDGIFFNDGITVDDLAFTRDGDDLVVTVSGDASKTVRVTNHFLGGDAAIDYIQPASGSMLDTAAINALVGSGGSDGGDNPPPDTGDDGDYGNVVDGTSAGEQLLGSGGRDLIHGLGGNDTVFGFGGDDKFEGGDGGDYLSGGNGSFSGSGNDILIGDAGVDTLVGEDGSDTLIGGAGGDKYVWQAGSDFDVIDNTGGGTDWLFFNGVDPSRLAWHRDGDDLVIMVDDDPSQGVRVQDHFLGGDMAIDYVQPGSGYAIPASQIDGLLTPMPGAGAQAQTLMATSESRVLAQDESLAPSGAMPIETHLHQPWQLDREDMSWLSWRAGVLGSRMRELNQVDETPHVSQTMPELHRLIEAMASFNPSTGAALDLLGLDDPMHAMRMSPLGMGKRQLLEQPMHEHLS